MASKITIKKREGISPKSEILLESVRFAAVLVPPSSPRRFLSVSSSRDGKWIYVYVVAQKTLYCTLPAEPVTQADVSLLQPLSLSKLYDGN